MPITSRGNQPGNMAYGMFSLALSGSISCVVAGKTALDLYFCNRLVHTLAHPGEGNIRAAMSNADLPLAIQQDQTPNTLNTLPEQIDSVASRFWCAVAGANIAHRTVYQHPPHELFAVPRI